MLCMGIFVVACSNDNLQETQSQKLNLDATENLNTISGTENPYNAEGERFYNFLLTMVDLIQRGEITYEETGDMIENSEFNQEIELNEYEKNIYKSYFSEKEFNFANLVSFENYLLNNEKIIEKDNLLKSAVFLKMSYKFADSYESSRGMGDFEYCLDDCMDSKLRAIFVYGGWYDKLNFLRKAAYNTASMVAGCAWDCA